MAQLHARARQETASRKVLCTLSRVEWGGAGKIVHNDAVFSFCPFFLDPELTQPYEVSVRVDNALDKERSQNGFGAWECPNGVQNMPKGADR